MTALMARQNIPFFCMCVHVHVHSCESPRKAEPPWPRLQYRHRRLDPTLTQDATCHHERLGPHPGPNYLPISADLKPFLSASTQEDLLAAGLHQFDAVTEVPDRPSLQDEGCYASMHDSSEDDV